MEFRRAWCAAIATLCVVTGCSSTRAPAPASASPPMTKPHTALRWILNGPALSNFTSDPDAVAFFRGARPFVLQRRNATVVIPSEWNALPIRSFTSVHAMRKAFEKNVIGPDVRGVLYDSEAWRFTPDDEQQDVAGSTKAAADLVHAHGLLFLTAPAVNLARRLAPSSAKRYEGYLKVNLAAESARYADVFVVQAQGSEADITKYQSFVAAAAKQARQANRNVVVLAGISTNPSGAKVDSRIVLAAIRATRGTVDGYWFNVPSPSKYCPGCTEFRPDMALDVIRQLAE